ncbi:putative ribonuclease H-like domain-containing protein [Tanacetum coccineum]
MNRTLIEAARTMLADSLLPTTFWAEAVSTACYIFNRVRVTKPQNKTPYELLFGHKLIISYIRPFGCHVTILNTLNVLGKFDGKSDEGFLVGYSLNSKAYRVYNLVTKRVEVNLHANFLEDKPNVKGVGYRWMFNIDYLTDTMNYIPVSLENQANPHAGTSKVTNSAGTSQTLNYNASEEKDDDAELIVVPSAVKNTTKKIETRKSSTNSKKEEILKEPQQKKEATTTSILENDPKILAFRKELEAIAQKHLGTIPAKNSTSILSVNSSSEPVNTGELDPDDSAMPELEIFHQSETGIFDEASYDEEGVVTDFNSLPTEIEVSPTPTFRIHNIHLKGQIIGDPKSAVQTRSKVWVLVDLPHGMKVIGTKWVYRNKRDERGVVVRNKARLVAQGHREEEGIDYDKVFAPVSRIEAISTIDEEVVKALYELHQAPRAWYATLSTFLEEHGYRRGTIDKNLFIKKDKKDIMLVQVYVEDIIFGSTRKSWCDEFEALMKDRFQMSSMDKYVADMLKKFDLASVKTTITPMETKMALTKDKEGADVDVNPKVSHLLAVKRIFKYLKGKPNLGLWYPRESSFDLEAFSDSDYGGSNLDRKSHKDHSGYFYTNEAEYVAAANCCGQVLWVQNQLLDYGFNFMNTKIHIDNESTICIVKNPVYHSKTKHIEIRHHFIRDCYEKKLISVEKIHTDLNVADLLTKPFDGPRFNFLVVSIGIAWICRCKEGVIRSLLCGNCGIFAATEKVKDLAEIVDFLRGVLTQTFGKAILTLVERVKTLEVALKRKTKRVLLLLCRGGIRGSGEMFLILDPLVSLLQELVTPSKTPSKTVNASGEEQVEDISPTTLEAAAILTKVKSAFEEVNTTVALKLVLVLKKLMLAVLDVNNWAAKFDDGSTSTTEERLRMDKDDKPTRRLERGRKTDARKDYIQTLIRMILKIQMKLVEKDDSTSGTKIPINPVPVAIKSPSIANYKIIKQGRKGVYQIVRENGTDMVYISFGAMLTDISRDDLTELYRIVMRKHGMNEPEDEFEKVLWEYLKNMFEEPLSTDSIWSLPGQQRLICWRYYDACRVHCLNLESVDIYMLIERKYPLSAEVCKAMLDKKLQGGKPDEDCYKLLKMMEKQAGIRK